MTADSLADEYAALQDRANDLADIYRAQIVRERRASLEPGVYEKNGEVYVVKFNREKTRLYAKQLVELGVRRLNEDDERVSHDFIYDPKAIDVLRIEDKMTLERGKALAVRYGVCLACQRILTDAVSVERGIGPVCRKRFAV